MSQKCELTGKTIMVGNNVSHANNKTRRRFNPNLSKVSFFSESLNANFVLKVSKNALRTVDIKGGFDAFMKGVNKEQLSPKAIRIYHDLAKKTKTA